MSMGIFVLLFICSDTNSNPQYFFPIVFNQFLTKMKQLMDYKDKKIYISLSCVQFLWKDTM